MGGRRVYRSFTGCAKSDSRQIQRGIFCVEIKDKIHVAFVKIVLLRELKIYSFEYELICFDRSIFEESSNWNVSFYTWRTRVQCSLASMVALRYVSAFRLFAINAKQKYCS